MVKKLHFAHTASENKGTNDAFYDDIFEKAGAIRATTWQEFLDISMALGMQPAPKGDNIVMITNGGGSGLSAVITLNVGECQCMSWQRSLLI